MHWVTLAGHIGGWGDVYTDRVTTGAATSMDGPCVVESIEFPSIPERGMNSKHRFADGFKVSSACCPVLITLSIIVVHTEHPSRGRISS
jgi:hypothetical protein